MSLTIKILNKHPDKQIALLAKIIRNQGWRQPITVSKRSGFIVKGHGRFQAAKVLNVELVPVEYQDYETEAAEYADLLADNRIAELAEPDADMIDDLLKDAMFEDFDLELTGFTDENLMLDETKLEKMEINRPPNMTWHLIGIPTVRAHEIQDQIDNISKIENIIIETGFSD